jgi:hypothetical protein
MYPYYQCGGAYYDRVYYQNQVTYVTVSPPAGGEVEKLDNPTTLEVNGTTYYIDGDTFYQRVTREGKDVYVIVDPPLGVEVDDVPEAAVVVSVGGVQYLQYDKIFYRQVADVSPSKYVIVASPY